MARCLLLGLTILLFTEASMAVEEPKYSVIEKSDNFELRSYRSMIVAETTVSGSLDEASSAGFKVIADYIFGNNTSRAGNSEKVSMTAPVTMGSVNSDAFTMDSFTVGNTKGQWRMHFVMPAEHTMDSLPTPNNSAVNLRVIPERKYAVIRFSGFTSEAKIAKLTTELLAWLASKGIKPSGTPVIARYNPPWTLPFLRRNEVMVTY